ncbi:hypothetical protein D3C80_1982680 [compost metagenome]
MVTLQFLELQGVARQRRDQFAKPLVVGEQAMETGVELLALRVVDPQVERVAVDLRLIEQRALVEVFEGLQALEPRQAADHRQDA